MVDIIHVLKDLRASNPKLKCRQLISIEQLISNAGKIADVWLYEGYVSGKAKGERNIGANRHVNDAITMLLELKAAINGDLDNVYHSNHSEKHSLIIANGSRFPGLFAEGESIKESPLVIKPKKARWEGVDWKDVTK